MAVDRNKFKPTPMTAVKKLDGEIGQRRGYSNYDRAGYHSIDQGDNKFRIYPAHPSSKEGVFWMPKSVAFLSIETELRDEQGEPTGEKVLKRRPVFTSDIHGPKDLSGKDLIRMYMSYAKAKFDQMFETEEEKKKAGDLMYNWQKGINPSLSWVMYADKYDDKGQRTLGILEVSNGVKKKINEVASEMDTGDNAIAVDPFTDPDDGIAIIINKVGQKLETEYKVSLESIKKSKFNVQLVPTPLEDSDLEKLETFESLESMFLNSFKRSDFEKQKEGLMRFDAENEFYFFEEPDFIEQVEDFQDLVFKLIPEEGRYEDDGTDELPFVPEKEHKAKAAKLVSPSIKSTPKVEEPEEEEYEEQEEDDNMTEGPTEPEPVAEIPSVSATDRIAEIKRKMAERKLQGK